MSLLKRIEHVRAGTTAAQELGVETITPETPADDFTSQNGPVVQTLSSQAQRLIGQVTVRESFREAKFRVQAKVIAELDPKIDTRNVTLVRRQIEDVFGRIVEEEGLALTRTERLRMLEQVVDEILGLGPLEPLLRDDTVTEVMVNGPRQVYVERLGKLELTDVAFMDDEHVMRIIDRIIAPIGRRLDSSSPMVDARLPDGSRVNAIIPPLSLVGPVVTVRKFAVSPLTVQDLIAFGTATGEMFEFLKACVEARLNIFVSGGTGSGKTTTLNVMSSFIPSDERIVTIEDAAELQLRQEHVVTLEARPPEHRRPGRDSDPRACPKCIAHAPRPDRGRRGPRRRSSRHASGNEHGPRWLDVDRPCQQPA